LLACTRSHRIVPLALARILHLPALRHAYLSREPSLHSHGSRSALSRRLCRCLCTHHLRVGVIALRLQHITRVNAEA